MKGVMPMWEGRVLCEVDVEDSVVYEYSICTQIYILSVNFHMTVLVYEINAIGSCLFVPCFSQSTRRPKDSLTNSFLISFKQGLYI